MELAKKFEINGTKFNHYSQYKTCGLSLIRGIWELKTIFKQTISLGINKKKS